MRILPVLLVLIGCVPRIPVYGAATYRYVAVCGGNVCLVAADGVTRLDLAKGTEHSTWSGPAVSANGAIVAVLTTDTGSEEADSPIGLFSIDPLTGTRQLIFKGRGFHMPDSPVWLSRDVLLLERVDKNGLDLGVYAINTRTCVANRVVKPLPDNEFEYDEYLPSPSGKLLATTLGVTAGEWISVNDIARGKSYWRTNPGQGMVGFSGAVWAADSKSLFVSLYKDDELAESSPGGLWKFDVLTGKQHLWKYKNQSVEGVWASPDHKILALARGKHVQYIRASDGGLMFDIPQSRMGDIYGVCFRGSKGSVICGSKRLAIVDPNGKTKKEYDVHGIAEGSTDVRCSPVRDAVMYFTSGTGGATGVIDLTDGKVTRIAPKAEYEDIYIDWLQQDIVR